MGIRQKIGEFLLGDHKPKALTTMQMARHSGTDLLAMGYNVAPAVDRSWTGNKFPGGYGVTNILAPDYWTLRARSNELFTTNLYARGLIRRLVTNEINTGLWPEAMPDEATLGLAEGALDDWSEDLENRFFLWAKTPRACDFKKASTFNKLQAMVRREALIAGDVLVVLQQDPITKRPSVMLVKGENVRTPLDDTAAGRNVEHGVELDSAGRHIAYFIDQKDGKSKRVPSVSGRTGRRVAWLVYGTDHRIGTVRGMPLLGLVLQSLKELDRYRDAAQRAAVVNSMLAMFIKKTEDKPGTKPLTNAALKKANVDVSSTSVIGSGSNEPRELNFSRSIPGVVMEELQQGEEPVAFQSHVDVDFGKFEEVMISTLAWANEIPPEILKLAFSSNYAASQAGINELKIYLNMFRTDFGEQFNAPIYQEWVLSEALLDKIGESVAILNAWNDKANFENFTAWVLAEWSGAIKPSTDILKQAKGYGELLDRGWITNARATRETTGQKFTRNMRKLKRENELLVEAKQPLADFEEANPNVTTTEAMGKLGSNILLLSDKIDDLEAQSDG